MAQFSLPENMSAWQLHKYGTISDLTLSNSASIPEIRPDHVLVEVHAASINPIDILALGGFGSSLLNYLRKTNGMLNNGSEFPIILGRDFSGRIVQTGKSVDSTKFKVGDEVFGTGELVSPGSHAQYVAVSASAIAHKPNKLSHIEAASLAYVAATVWSAVCTSGGYSQNKLANKRTVVFGGSGGIGTFTIQLLKAWGAEVLTTCSTDAIDKMRELGADVVIDYTKNDVKKELKKLPGFDLIIDASGGKTIDYATSYLRPFTGATYIKLTVPLPQNVNDYGMALGLAKSGVQYLYESIQYCTRGMHVLWGGFKPSGVAMETVAKLVDDGKIVPQVQRVFPFSDLHAAYELVAAGRGIRGKIVLDMSELVESATAK